MAMVLQLSPRVTPTQGLPLERILAKTRLASAPNHWAALVH